MVREFEGKTEKEAIDRAISELNLDREEFDVEIVESQKKGVLFRRGPVRIRVHLSDEDLEAIGSTYRETQRSDADGDAADAQPPTRAGEPDTASRAQVPASDIEKGAIAFLEGLIEKMGYTGQVAISRREERKIVLGIESPNTGILIGRKGKNLDALQLLTNVYVARLTAGFRVVVDAENYRVRREQDLIRLARQSAEQVRRSQGSRLLEPMNPFERRLIHVTLNELDDIDTQSEGEGLYKQVRVIYRGIPDR